MKPIQPFCALLCAWAILFLPGLASANDVARPLAPPELRALVQSGQIQRLAPILEMVTRHAPGTAVDARAFGGQAVTYVLLMYDQAGQIKPVLVDAQSGTFLDLSSERARSIARAMGQTRLPARHP